jgi:carboxyl-terminal processing protease
MHFFPKRPTLFLLFLFSLFLSLHITAQTTNLQNNALAIKQMVAKEHIQPRLIDDQFSIDFFNAFIDALDPARVYFTMEDLKVLEKHRILLDDQMVSGKWDFFSECVELYKRKITAVETMISANCFNPFNFTLSEYYSTITDTVRTENDKKLKEKWYFFLKEQVLELLGNSAANELIVKGNFDKRKVLANEEEARNKIRSRYLGIIKSIGISTPQFPEELSNIYLNALLSCIDPHSSFMNVTDKQNFQASLNTEGYFFGLSLTENEKGEVLIDYLEPGGPAWASGMLNKNDVLLKLKWANKKQVDLQGLDAIEVSALLDGSNTEKLELIVRKQNSIEETVIMQKHKLDNEENIVKSFLLKGDKNIGFITLPSFYTQWEDATGSKCAGDVATEIVKLKKDSIHGLILDLRYNGGGSLQEAVDMAGIFIEEGAVAQLKTKDPKIVVLKDVNRGVIYTGPLLLLVNGSSASSSELLAATLQDYNRAVIAGSRTFGKATGQEILSVRGITNTVVSYTSGQDNYLKLTTSKLFRCTGKSVQKKGVQPDVVIPDFYSEFDEREAFLKYALTSDTVAAYKYFKPLTPLPVATLKQSSAGRMSKDPRIQIIRSLVETISNDQKTGKVSLKWDDLEKQLYKEFEEGKIQKKEMLLATNLYTAFNNSLDAKYLASNEIAYEINQRWLDRLQRDFQIQESFQILLDLIKIKNNN